ncbi:MAG: response regulator [Pseudomonadales bacterium]
MSNKVQVLVVEDEATLAELLADYLRQASYRVQVIGDGEQVIDWVREHEPALIVLDLMLPGKDGLSLCRELRAFTQVPILMATARVDEIDRLLGLELGADDYICKPYSPREVVARVKANLRRVQSEQLAESDLSAGGEQSAQCAIVPGLQLDADRYQLIDGDDSIELTAVEFELFSILFNHPGVIFKRSQLMDRMYQDHRIVSDRTIDSHIRKIRKKLTDLSLSPDSIHSVYGVGYRFELS